MKTFFLSIMLFSLMLSPIIALAATNPCSLEGVQASPNNNTTVPSSLPKCVSQIYVWSLGIATLLALLMVIVGGYYVMTSSGNAEQATKGKEYITGAIIGLVLLFGAYLLLQTINPDLVNFNLESVKDLNKSVPSAPRTP